jgi:hypothetical protein
MDAPKHVNFWNQTPQAFSSLLPKFLKFARFGVYHSSDKGSVT